MGGYIGKKVVKEMVKAGVDISKSKVLVMGITFKEDVSDIRNSKVVDIIRELRDYGIVVDVIDPHASSKDVEKEYGFALNTKLSNNYNAVIAAVSHKEWANLNIDDFRILTGNNKNAILVDIKGFYKNLKNKMNYWSL